MTGKFLTRREIHVLMAEAQTRYRRKMDEFFDHGIFDSGHDNQDVDKGQRVFESDTDADTTSEI